MEQKRQRGLTRRTVEVLIVVGILGWLAVIAFMLFERAEANETTVVTEPAIALFPAHTATNAPLPQATRPENPQPALTADDATTTQTLANTLRTMANSLGLMSTV